MKILFVVEHFYPHVGGAEKCLLDLAVSLSKRGHDVRVVTSDSGGKKGEHYFGRIKIYSFPWRSIMGHPIPRVKDIFKHASWADIIQTSTYTAAPKALRAAKKTNKPCVIIGYEYLGDKWFQVESFHKAIFLKYFERYIYKMKFSRYIAISKATQRDIVKSGINKSLVTTVYPLFNDYNFWKKKKSKSYGSSETKTFLYYGRPGKTKGIYVLLKAINKLSNIDDIKINFKLILSKDPIRNRKKINQYIENNKLGDLVEVEESKPLKELRKSLLDSYCVIVPSLTEGFGYSAYQACLLGKNIITSDAGSLPEVIFGKTIVFKNGNDDSLVMAIIKASEGKYSNRPQLIKGDQTAKVINLYRGLIS